MDTTSKLANQIANLPRSGIRDFFELVIGRDDVISLGVGEPDRCTPWHIREAAIYSLEKGQTTYTSNLGLEKLRQAITGYVKKHFKLDYDPKSEVIVTVGVSEALDLALRAILNPGDEVLYHEPCYVSYNPSIAMAYGVPVPIQTKAEDQFTLRADAVAEKITPRTKAIMLNFPTNPTGAVMSDPVEMEKIVQLIVKHDLLLLSDEIYSELLYDGAEHKSLLTFPGVKERAVLFHGFSKAFAMTGFRLGYACAPKPLIEAMMKIHQYAMLCASITSQMAGIEALENGADCVEEMRRDYERRRNLVVSSLNDAGLPTFKPGGAFYVFPDIRPTGLTSKEFAVRLLQEKNVAVVPGTAFGEGGEGFVRACYATHPDLLVKAMAAIKDFTRKL